MMKQIIGYHAANHQHLERQFLRDKKENALRQGDAA
jgi:hypothetical protein